MDRLRTIILLLEGIAILYVYFRQTIALIRSIRNKDYDASKFHIVILIIITVILILVNFI